MNQLIFEILKYIYKKSAGSISALNYTHKIYSNSRSIFSSNPTLFLQPQATIFMSRISHRDMCSAQCNVCRENAEFLGCTYLLLLVNHNLHNDIHIKLLHGFALDGRCCLFGSV